MKWTSAGGSSTQRAPAAKRMSAAETTICVIASRPVGSDISRPNMRTGRPRAQRITTQLIVTSVMMPMPCMTQAGTPSAASARSAPQSSPSAPMKVRPSPKPAEMKAMSRATCTVSIPCAP